MSEIRTGRLLLRPFRESDYDGLCEFLSQLRDDEYEGYPGISYDSCREQLEERLGSEEYYAIELAESGKEIGNIYCGKRAYDARELGYIVNRDHQRKGYAAEAVSAVLSELFGEGTHRIYAMCDPGNTASWRLLEKLGFRREAHFRQDIWFWRDREGAPLWKDTYVYAQLESEREH